MALSFPEDLLLEVLFRLKDVPRSLFRCATACTRWRQLVAEPAFLRRCWPHHDVSSSIVGFFSQQLTWPDQDASSSNVARQLTWPAVRPTPCFTPTPRSALVPRPCSLGSFMPAAPAGVFDRAVALLSRHGLLLVRLDTTATRGYQNQTILDLAVCNLVTGTCHMLPALKFGSDFDKCEWNGYAILTGADYRSNDDDEPVVLPTSNSSFFKVVIISFRNDDDDVKSYLHTFSSDEASWRVRANCVDGMLRARRKYGSSSRAIVRRGTAHWLLYNCLEIGFCVLNLNMRTCDISFTKVPAQMNCYPQGGYPKSDPLLTLAVNGALLLIWMQTGGTQIDIWEEQPNKDDGQEWVSTRNIKLKQLGDERNNRRREVCCLGEKCGTLLVHDTIDGVYTADLHTGIMEEVVDSSRKASIIPWETVPLEVDWLAIFASRLDTREQRMEKQVTYPAGWKQMYLRGIKRRKTK